MTRAPRLCAQRPAARLRRRPVGAARLPRPRATCATTSRPTSRCHGDAARTATRACCSRAPAVLAGRHRGPAARLRARRRPACLARPRRLRVERAGAGRSRSRGRRQRAPRLFGERLRPEPEAVPVAVLSDRVGFFARRAAAPSARSAPGGIAGAAAGARACWPRPARARIGGRSSSTARTTVSSRGSASTASAARCAPRPPPNG